MWKRALALLILNCLLNPAFAQQAPENEQLPTIRTTTREVVLDVIVRDKHHHTIANLRPGEIEVLEDGVKQKINSFRNVQGAEQLLTEQALAKSNLPVPSSGTPKTTANALREVNFVSVVFAQIAPLNLEFAREAVMEFLKSDRLSNTYVTIYRFDHSLHLVQPYTADNTLLINAVNAAAKGVKTGNGPSTAVTVASTVDTVNQINTALNPQQAEASGVQQLVTDPLWARNAAAEDASLPVGSALVWQAELASKLRFAESIVNGMDAFDALRELVRVQAKLPGRKVVLYLADGLTLPVHRRDVVDSVIGYANRMEVAFYAVDTRGLSLDDPLMQSLSDQARAGAESSVDSKGPRWGHLVSDDIDLAASSDKQLAMRELAESTGGFAVINTNEIALPMQRVMEDIRTHYELAYTPSAMNYDGHFRKIQVRITRPNVTVQTRSGYFALPVINGDPLQPFEMTALHAIDAHPATVEFPYQIAPLRFRPKAAGADYEVAFDVPVSSLQVVTDPKTGKGRIRVSLVALIHNSDGEVVGKVSRDLAREVEKADLPLLGDDHILYAEPVELPGGHYLIDTAVTDELAEKSAVKRLSVFVDSGKDFGVSSLQLVRGVQQLPGPRDRQDPFQTDSGRIVPSLVDSMPAGKPIDVYFVVYPASASEAVPAITLQLYRDGREVGQKTLPPSSPQSDGSMPMLLRINPDPGQCDVVITAHQGPLAAKASLSVKIAPGGAAKPN